MAIKPARNSILKFMWKFDVEKLDLWNLLQFDSEKNIRPKPTEPTYLVKQFNLKFNLNCLTVKSTKLTMLAKLISELGGTYNL